MSDPVPTSIELAAPVIARHGIDIGADVDLVWQVHVQVGSWHEWQTDMEDLIPDSPVLHAGGWFTWSTSGLSIRSAVHRVDEVAHETFWGGPANGIVGLHRWRFTADPSGRTRVETEESWSGPPVEADIDGSQKALDDSLIRWLDLMRARAEALADS